MFRRQIIAALAVGGVSVTAGCSFLTGQDALRFSASPATVRDPVVSESSYEETSVSEQVITREFGAANQTRTVEVANQLAQYERQVDLGPLGSKRAAVAVSFTSPEVEVATETFNPIEGMSEREILQQFDSQYESISVGDRVGSRSVTVLGQSRSLAKFEGTAQLAGTDADVFVHGSKFKHGSDFVVTVAIYPRRLDGEEGRVVTLLNGLTHSTES